MPMLPSIPSMAKNGIILPNGFLNRIMIVTPTLTIRDGKIIPILRGHIKLRTHIMPHTQGHIFPILPIRGPTTLFHSNSRINTSLSLHLQIILSIFRRRSMLQALDVIDIAISRCEGKISSSIEQVVDMEYREDAWDVEMSITNSEDSRVEELLLSKVSHTPREEEQIEPIVVIEGVDLDLEKDLESELNNELNIQSSPQDDSTCKPDTPFQSKTLEESLPIIVQSPLELNDQVQPVVEDATPPIKPPPLSNFHKVEPIDFLGADNFDLFFHPCLVDIVNNLKINLVRIACLVELKFLKRLMQLRHSKYLILWHGRVQFLKESSKGGEMFIFVTLHGVVDVPNSRECGTFFVNYF
ncbi:hypothetical protein RHGRI_022183 [Rhododendron griersonianum]|uniref:Uncharacterized protein n=1 Tax=Rhododendron griersonianum TaxID=479676 RepID=A0AAV6JRZ7_9ERIC|nr:hypothetical protein RHGRI_022183 [Rhododendron griersonianum]